MMLLYAFYVESEPDGAATVAVTLDSCIRELLDDCLPLFGTDLNVCVPVGSGLARIKPTKIVPIRADRDVKLVVGNSEVIVLIGDQRRYRLECWPRFGLSFLFPIGPVNLLGFVILLFPGRFEIQDSSKVKHGLFTKTERAQLDSDQRHSAI